jgi:hypothetical protein
MLTPFKAAFAAAVAFFEPFGAFEAPPKIYASAIAFVDSQNLLLHDALSSRPVGYERTRNISLFSHQIPFFCCFCWSFGAILSGLGLELGISTAVILPNMILGGWCAWKFVFSIRAFLPAQI